MRAAIVGGPSAVEQLAINKVAIMVTQPPRMSRDRADARPTRAGPHEEEPKIKSRTDFSNFSAEAC